MRTAISESKAGVKVWLARLCLGSSDMAPLATYKELRDGTYSLKDVCEMNEILDEIAVAKQKEFRRMEAERAKK